MAYQWLRLDPKTPARVKVLVNSLQHRYLREVHTMLRLPQPDRALDALS